MKIDPAEYYEKRLTGDSPATATTIRILQYFDFVAEKVRKEGIETGIFVVSEGDSTTIRRFGTAGNITTLLAEVILNLNDKERFFLDSLLDIGDCLKNNREGE